MNPLSYDPVATYQLGRQRAAGAELAAETDRRAREAGAGAPRPSTGRRPSRRWSGAVVRRLRLAH